MENWVLVFIEVDNREANERSQADSRCDRHAKVEAQAALRWKFPMPEFMSSFVSSQVIRGDEDE